MIKIDTDRMVHLATELKRLDAKAEEIAEQRAKLEAELQRLTDEEKAIEAEEGAINGARDSVRNDLRAMLGVDSAPPPIIYEPPRSSPGVISKSVAARVSEAVAGAVSSAPNGANGVHHEPEEEPDGEEPSKTTRARIIAYARNHTIFELDDLVAAGFGTRKRMSSAAHHMVDLEILTRPSPGVFQWAGNRIAPPAKPPPPPPPPPPEASEAYATHADQILAYASKHDVISIAEVARAYPEISYQSLATAMSILAREERLRRVGRGAYRLPHGSEASEAEPAPEPALHELHPRDIVLAVARKQHRLTPSDVVAASGGRLNANQAAKAMIAMEGNGELHREKRGIYTLPKRRNATT